MISGGGGGVSNGGGDEICVGGVNDDGVLRT
jgi:hypothetical protein